jgi:hypothetical protein
MSSEETLWYRLGYLLEQARSAPLGRRRRESAGDERARARRTRSKEGHPLGWPSADDLIGSGAVALAGKLLSIWQPRHRAGPARLLRAGAAGVAAALLVELLRPLLQGRAELPTIGGETAERLFAGAGQGLLYGAVLEPRLPGPPVVKGALYGSAEYAVHPAGGLGRFLGAEAPLGRVPVVGRVFREMDVHDRAYTEHVAFGIALALLYGSSPSSNGIADEDDE